MKQTAARYFPFSFVLTYSVVLDPVLSPGVLHSLRRSPCDAVSGDISCGGPGPFCVRGAFPGLGVVLPLLLAALRPSVVLAASVSRRSACCSAGVNRSSTFPSWTWRPPSSSSPCRAICWTICAAFSTAACPKPSQRVSWSRYVLTTARMNSCEAMCRATKRWSAKGTGLRGSFARCWRITWRSRWTWCGSRSRCRRRSSSCWISWYSRSCRCRCCMWRVSCCASKRSLLRFFGTLWSEPWRICRWSRTRSCRDSSFGVSAFSCLECTRRGLWIWLYDMWLLF